MGDQADKADGVASGLDDTAVAATAPETEEPSAEPVATRMRLVHAGDTLGRYTLDEEVGEGGMATVFRARDRELRREVAVKVLFPHLAKRDEVVRRFHREARSAASLEHPNILRIYDVGGATGGDPPFIVMELIRGRSLLAELEMRGPMLSEIVACIGALLADALGAAHAAGIVHRDVKPANVLIDPGTPASAGALHSRPGGRLLLADFGVARLETEDSLVTKTGAVLGTPAYMSPEQATGDTSTRKSDLYSLGATLYQLATGSLPYSGSPAKVLSLIASGSFVPAVRRRGAVGGDLSRVVDRLMAVDPAARPADAATVAAELRAIAATGGLADAKDELTAYLAGPEAFLAARTPAVIAAITAAAERAMAEGKLPRAMALADRASALAPDDAAVAALVGKVTEGGRSSSRRRAVMLAAAGLAVAGGAAFGGYALLSHSGSPPSLADAATPLAALSLADAASGPPPPLADAVAASPPPLADAAAASPPPLADAASGPPQLLPDAATSRPQPLADAATRPPQPPADAGHAASLSPHLHDAGTASRPLLADAAAAAPAPTDAPAAPPPADAAPPPPPPAADGTIVITNDTWCRVSLDDVFITQITHSGSIRASAGHHTVRCEQPGIQWTQPVDVPAGGSVPASGSLLPQLTVTITSDVLIDGTRHGGGTLAHLSHGSHRFEPAGGGPATRLDIATDCTLGQRFDDRGTASFVCVSGSPH